MMTWPSSVFALAFFHCHSCERLISAVAASSIRLWMATALLPRSHARGSGCRPRC